MSFFGGANMIEKAKPNYGMKNIVLTMNDVKYMLSIINSNLTDEEKAAKLYSFCDYYTISTNVELYTKLNIREVDILNRIMRLYKDYDLWGYFKLSNNPYKCSIEEMELRISKLNLAYEIVNSDDISYVKCEKLIKLFGSASKLKRSYTLFIKFGKNDDRLDSCREALNNIDLIISTLATYEEKKIASDVKYVSRKRRDFELYKYASFIISSYVNREDSYNEEEFFDEFGIDRSVLDSCARNIKELNVSLYQTFLKKVEDNKKLKILHTKDIISNLAKGITTGYLEDDTPFDLFTFIKMTPFKYSYFYDNQIDNFMVSNNMMERDIVMSFLKDNRLDTHSAFLPLKYDAIYGHRINVNGVEITKEDNDVIIKYLVVNDIPIIGATYRYAREKYINGEITKEMVEEQKKNKVEPLKKVLIPTSNKKR